MIELRIISYVGSLTIAVTVLCGAACLCIYCVFGIGLLLL